ncbi:MAG: lytic transglycosylase domain-containing protein [Candidatus Riflebacteria bacterium]|nr:lytic transglycosylase domain-containing protein [Candidatus Riflebacteria bacterium]
MPVIKNKYGQTITVEMYMKAIMWIESGGTHRKSDGTMVGSSVGAQGFMALMPATAKELGVSAQDPKGNIAGGCKLFQKLFSGNYSPAGKATGIDKLMLVACSYNAGPWSKLVKGSWQDLKNTGSSVQSYGIKLKCCLGLELTADEKAYCKSKMAGGRSVEAYANEHYSYSQGLGL